MINTTRTTTKRRLVGAFAGAAIFWAGLVALSPDAEAWYACQGATHAGEPGFYHLGDGVQGQHPNTYENWYKVNNHNGFATYWRTASC